jgi:hypothetical protein
MPNSPLSSLNPVQPSDFMKNDIPAETDDLQLGRRNPEHGNDGQNAGSEPDSEPRRTGGSPNDPHGGRE